MCGDPILPDTTAQVCLQCRWVHHVRCGADTDDGWRCICCLAHAGCSGLAGAGAGAALATSHVTWAITAEAAAPSAHADCDLVQAPAVTVATWDCGTSGPVILASDDLAAHLLAETGVAAGNGYTGGQICDADIGLETGAAVPAARWAAYRGASTENNGAVRAVRRGVSAEGVAVPALGSAPPPPAALAGTVGVTDLLTQDEHVLGAVDAATSASLGEGLACVGSALDGLPSAVPHDCHASGSAIVHAQGSVVGSMDEATAGAGASYQLVHFAPPGLSGFPASSASHCASCLATSGPQTQMSTVELAIGVAHFTRSSSSS